MLERDFAVREPRADRLDARGVFSLRRQQRDAAGHEHARQIAARRERHHHRGQTLVAGRDAHARRAGSAASESVVERSWRHRCGTAGCRTSPVVPCDRPSHGSVHDAAKGTAPVRLDARAPPPPSAVQLPSDRCDIRARSACRRRARMPPCVDRMRIPCRQCADGSQPMPAFCDQPKRSPEGRSRSISGVNGSAPLGPGTRVRISVSAGSSESKGLIATGQTSLSAAARHALSASRQAT